MRVRPLLALPLVAAVLLGASACAETDPAPVPADAWSATALSADLNGRGATDAGLPIAHLASDGDGGIWMSGLAGLVRLDADGARVGEPIVLPQDLGSLTDLAALDADTLALAVTDTVGRSALVLVDTHTADIRVLRREGEKYGDIAADGDGVVYVEIPEGEHGTIDVRRIDRSGHVTTLATDIPGREARLAVGPDGTVYLTTEWERMALSPDGSVRDRARIAAGSAVAVSPSGMLLWPASVPATGAPAPVALGPVVLDASEEARRIVDRSSVDCATHGLEAVGLPVPVACAAWDSAWLDDRTFVLSAGGEGGGALVRVTLPESASAG